MFSILPLLAVIALQGIRSGQPFMLIKLGGRSSQGGMGSSEGADALQKVFRWSPGWGILSRGSFTF